MLEAKQRAKNKKQDQQPTPKRPNKPNQNTTTYQIASEDVANKTQGKTKGQETTKRGKKNGNQTRSGELRLLPEKGPKPFSLKIQVGNHQPS